MCVCVYYLTFFFHTRDQNIANLPVQPVRPERGKQRKKRDAKPYADLKPTARRLRKKEYEKIFKEAASSMHKDARSVKVSLELDTGTQLSFFQGKAVTVTIRHWRMKLSKQSKM